MDDAMDHFVRVLDEEAISADQIYNLICDSYFTHERKMMLRKRLEEIYRQEKISCD